VLNLKTYTSWFAKYQNYIAVSLFSAFISGILIFLVIVPRMEPAVHVLYPDKEASIVRSASVSASLEGSEKDLGLDVININTASVDRLASLYNIGPKRAAAIIEYRKKKPFSNIQEIKNVSGIGVKTFERIKDYITVSE
jgi:comEA protein